VSKWTSLPLLISNVTEYGRRMQEAKSSGMLPSSVYLTLFLEIVIGNVVKHILYIIREEYATFKEEEALRNSAGPTGGLVKSRKLKLLLGLT
jgi:hypothetical protein